MLNTWIFLIAGLLILGLGAELMVRGSSAIAMRLGISPLVIGLTIVAFGTSAPELAVSVRATLNNDSAIALGNVIGSNIANIGLILGLAALMSPLKIERQLLRKEIPILIATSILLLLLLLDGKLGFIDGCVLFGGILTFLVYSYFESKKDKALLQASKASTYSMSAEFPLQETDDGPVPPAIWLSVLFVFVSIAMLVYGSTVFVASAVEMATFFGVSEAVIALTIVAVGTSVPELATTLMAVYKKNVDIGVGNIIGSNLFNILGILGISSLIGNIYDDQFKLLDFMVMLAFTLVLLPFAGRKFTLNRIEGLILLGSYIVYILFTTLSV